jgi:DNA-binding CsgD family transcriptional regulator
VADARVLEVIDLAYQAATDSTLWAPALEGVADVLGGWAASVIWYNDYDGVSGLSVRGDPEALRSYDNHFEAINPIQAGFDPLHRSGEARTRPVMTDRDCVDRGDLLASEYFNDFMQRYDIGSVMLITGAAFMVDGKAPAFNVFRRIGATEFDRPDVEAAAMLQRPLQRAYQMSQRLEPARRLNASLGDFVDQLTGAVFVVAGDGRIAYANPAGEAMLAQRDGIVCQGRRLRSSDGASQRALAALLAAAVDPVRRRGGSLALRRPSGRRPLALLATPTRGGPDPFSGEPLALVSVVDPELADPTPEGRLQVYFGLTPAEARVAAELMAGHDLTEIADRLGRSIHTVRIQTTRIREKTGAARQSEAVAVMLRSLGVGRLEG